MRVLSKLTFKNLLLNKARTVVTIIGIVLSTALLVALSGIATSFVKTLELGTIDMDGSQHVTFDDVPKDEVSSITLNKQTKSYYLIEVLEEKLNEANNLESILVALDKYALQENATKLTEGRMPKNSSEVVICDSYLLKDTKIGDTFTSQKGKDYKVVGKLSNIKNPGYINTRLFYATYMDEVEDKAIVSVAYKEPKNYKEITLSIVGKENKYGYSYNSELLRYQAFVMSDGNVKVITNMASILAFIIVLTSVICIRNSFAISITDKIRQYGMLASVGATPKQIRKNVLFEGVILGLIAIPLGVGFGILATLILVNISNALLPSLGTIDFTLYINPLIVLITVLLSAFTIYLSSIGSAIKASRISEIDAIKSTNDIKIKAKKMRTPKYIGKIFKIGGVFAHKNIKRNKSKFRVTTISLVVSIATFISVGSFLDLGFQMSNANFVDIGYNIQVTGVDSQKAYEYGSKLEGVKTSTYTKSYSYFYNYKNSDKDMYTVLRIATMDDNYYFNYLKENNIEYSQDVVLLLDKAKFVNEDEKLFWGNRYKEESEIELLTVPDNKDGEKITLNFVRPKNYPIGFLENMDDNILMSNSQFEKYATNKDDIMYNGFFLDCKDPYKVQEQLYNYSKDNELVMDTVNDQDMVDQMQNTMLLISIFLYGFISVISLVGLTNIFNSLSTNMNLRRREFATLQSIGMTKKELNKMINFECVSYVLKSLVWGVPLGVLGGYTLYKATMYGDFAYTFNFPIKQILIAFIVVFLVVYGIMKTSLNKISKQNIVETIRDENI